MEKYNLNDTIAAIATAVGESGIGIMRISGKQALRIADKIFVSKDNKKPSAFKTYTVHYGEVLRDAKIIDEVILTVMRGPKSYTREDIVEINCHGGIVALREVLDLALENGCRLAMPGEFTQRAFLNGRIDLAQAEAVLDIIRAKTDAGLRMGLEQLKGSLSSRLDNLRQLLLGILSEIEANIDFPEEEIGIPDLEKFSEALAGINKTIENILDSSRQGRILREGINVVICGKPNVGKSSLLNALLKCERAIVTPIAGTTRDTIEETIDIKGVPVRIVDTAGIIEPKDFIEKKAIQRSSRHINSADLALLLFDGSKKLSKDDGILMRKLKGKTTIAVINKIDLKQSIQRGRILERFSKVIDISAKKLKNIELLESGIADLVYDGKVSSPESIMVSNLRHIEALRKAKNSIAEALNSLDNKLSLEFIAQDLKEALGWLDNLLGRNFSEDLLEKIFSEFCIGK